MCSQIESNNTGCCKADLWLPEFSVRKPRKATVYKKSQSIKDFEKQYVDWYYRFKDTPYRVMTKFSDKGSNDLTKLIKAWFEINGGFAQRVNSGATYDPRLGIFRKGSGSTVGAADIMATFKGKAIHVEVKINKDKQRPAQAIFQKNVEEAGGIYFISKSYDNFLEQINQLSL
jgi:hypothetical protein